jgi:hypothetical protein
MAFTQQVQYSFTLMDELSVKATEVIYALADPTKTITNLVADWQAWAALITPLTSAEMLHGQVRIILTPTADQSGKPAAGSRVEQTAVFDFANASTDRRFGEPVPALANSKISSGAINLADADVAAFVTAMHTATANSEPTNNSFQVLTALTDAFLSFRKRRKQLLRATYEL